jgi:hypothetical protein
MAGLDSPENTQAPPPGFDDSYGSTLCQPTRMIPGETVEFKVYPDEAPAADGLYVFFMGVGSQECSEDVLDGSTEYVHSSDCDVATNPDCDRCPPVVNSDWVDAYRALFIGAAASYGGEEAALAAFSDLMNGLFSETNLILNRDHDGDSSTPRRNAPIDLNCAESFEDSIVIAGLPTTRDMNLVPAALDDDGRWVVTCTLTVPNPSDAGALAELIGRNVTVQAIEMGTGNKTNVTSGSVVENTDYVSACLSWNSCYNYEATFDATGGWVDLEEDCCAWDTDVDGLCDYDECVGFGTDGFDPDSDCEILDDCIGTSGEMLDCNGDCVDDFWVGDGFCDANLMCEAYDFDGGDCCDVVADDGSCAVPSDNDGDGVDDYLDVCPYDVGPSIDDQPTDCDEVCVGADVIDAWVGDGDCDIRFNCDRYGADGGDCAGVVTDWSYDGCDGATDCDGVDVDVTLTVDEWFNEPSFDVMVGYGLFDWDEDGSISSDELYDAQVIAENGQFYGIEQTLTVDLDNLPTASGDYYVCVVLTDSVFDGGVSGEVVQAGDDGETELSWSGTSYLSSADYCVNIADDTFNEVGSMIDDGDGCLPGFSNDCDGNCILDVWFDIRTGSGVCDDGSEDALYVRDETDTLVYMNLNCPAFDFDGTDSCSDCLPGADACVDVECLVFEYYQDGYCDFFNNTEECGWDGGDCCEESCESTPDYECGAGLGYECIDPEYYDGGCLFNFTAYGSASCDTAYEEAGFTCAALEAAYYWDCEGCDCPGDSGLTPEEECAAAAPVAPSGVCASSWFDIEAVLPGTPITGAGCYTCDEVLYFLLPVVAGTPLEDAFTYDALESTGMDCSGCTLYTD